MGRQNKINAQQQQQQQQQSHGQYNANYNQYQQQQQNIMMQQQQQTFFNNSNQQTMQYQQMSVPYLSSVPNTIANNAAAATSAPPLNRATTAPATAPNSNQNNKQLKQLENTVEQLRSHFVQLLQQLHHSNNSNNAHSKQSSNINQNVNAMTNHQSVPNVVGPLTNVLNPHQNSVSSMNQLRSMLPSPMAPTLTTATNYQTPTNRSQQPAAYTFPASLSSMPLSTNPMINPFNPQPNVGATATNQYLLQNLQSPTNLNAAALYQNNQQQQQQQAQNQNNFNLYNHQ